jgi:hypothetical protein
VPDIVLRTEVVKIKRPPFLVEIDGHRIESKAISVDLVFL